MSEPDHNIIAENNENGEKSKSNILRFCSNCGKELEWSKELKFCLYCGVNLIPFIPKDKINDWFESNYSESEIDELYDNSIKSLPKNLIKKKYTPRYVKKKPWGWKAALGIPILAYLVKVVLAVIVALILIFTSSIAFNPENLELMFTENQLLWITILDLASQVIFILVPFGVIGYNFPNKTTWKEKMTALGIPMGRDKLSQKQFSKEVLIGFGLSILMTITAYGTQYLSGYITSKVYGIPMESLLNDDSSGMTSVLPTTLPMLLLFSLLMFVSIGPSEEVLFRGFCQKGLERSWGKRPALIITALYFTLFHIYIYILISPALFFFSFFPYFVVSLFLGFIYQYRENLIAAIFAHAFYNTIQFVIFYIFAIM